ncbi:MAG: hypothetical protein A2Z19_02175 [Deltaproteobacteria bacterium RBG_16_54_18]|nr:MAG: hypothetical protein A2Z19_02175 [Deltaproteobacteria bacterium RBG_16_54_18]
MKKTGIVRHQVYLEHRTGIMHPENPQRLQAIYDMLDQRDFGDAFVPIEPRYATLDEILWVHDSRYVDRVLDSAEKARVQFDPDTVSSPKTYQAALMAVGGVLEAIKRTVIAEVNNAFALIRPPGHHALRDQAMGFCIFNNEAIGAHYARKVHGLKRILIIDWDVHHGNGIQDAFYDDRSVLYFSVHRDQFFPWTGAANEVGVGRGKGYTVNVPLARGGSDTDYGNIFRHLLAPVAEQFEPELIIVSAGFDTHYDDPIGLMKVTPEGFARMTTLVLELAASLCEGRLVLALEGGYNPQGLRDSVEMVLRELIGQSRIDKDQMQHREDTHYEKIAETIDWIKDIHRRSWKF